MAPEVIVEQVSAKANWKSQNARKATPVLPYPGVMPCRKKYWWPMKPFPAPNWKAKPIDQYRRPQRHVSNAHSSSTLTVSRDRAKPASRPMNPACMKNTMNAANSTQTVLSGLTTSSAFNAGVVWPSIVAPALVLKYQVIAHRPRPRCSYRSTLRAIHAITSSRVYGRG